MNSPVRRGGPGASLSLESPELRAPNLIHRSIHVRGEDERGTGNRRASCRSAMNPRPLLTTTPCELLGASRRR